MLGLISKPIFLLFFALALVGGVSGQSNGPLSRDLVDSLPPNEKRFALIIGVDKYESGDISSLKGASNDANALKNALRDFAGFPEDQIVVLASNGPEGREPNRNNILLRLAKLKATMPPGSLLLVSFSGHGIERDGKAFLLPSNAELQNDLVLLQDTAIEASTLLDRIRSTGAKQVLILLDACRNDPEAGRGYSGNELTDAYRKGFTFEAKNKDIEAFATLYATGVGKRAYENGEKKQGYFSLAVVEALSGSAANPATGEVTLGELVKYVQTNVKKQVALNWGGTREQQPFAIVGGYRADELVIAIGKKPSLPVPGPSIEDRKEASAGEIAYWTLIERKGTCLGYEKYLADYPDGVYVKAARMGLLLCDRSEKTKSSVESKPQSLSDLPILPVEKPAIVDGKEKVAVETLAKNTSPALVDQISPKIDPLSNDTVSQQAKNETVDIPLLPKVETTNNIPAKTSEKNERPAKTEVGIPVVVVSSMPEPTVIGQIKPVTKPEALKPKSQSATESWNLVRRTRGITEIRTFISDFPESPYILKAKSLLQNVVWADAFSSSDIVKYEDYIKEFPTGPNVKLAKKRIAKLERLRPAKIAPLSEKEVWQKIQNSNDVIELDSFVKQFPNGEFFAIANSRLENLKENATLEFLRSRWERMLEDGNSATVLRETTVVLSNEPLNFIALTARSSANDHLGRMNEGERDAGSIVKAVLEPSSIFAYEALAFAKIRLGHFDDALNYCDRGLRIEIDNPRLLYLRGTAYVKKQEYQLGANDLENVLKIDATRLWAYYQLESAYAGLKRTNEIYSIMDRLINTLPYKSGAFLRRAVFLKQQNKLAEALNDVNVVLNKDADNIDAYLIRGMVYELQNRHDLADIDFTKAVVLGPDRSFTFIERAAFYVRRGQNENALRDLSSAISLDPIHPNAYLMRGKVYLKDRRTAEAISDFNKHLENDPQSAEGMLYVARFKTNLAEQIDYVERAIKIAPTFAEAYFFRGRLYAGRKKFSEAVKDYDKAIELDGSNGLVYIDRSISHFHLKAFTLAVDDITRAIELMPDRVVLYLLRAKAYKELGLKEKAKADELRAKPIKDIKFGNVWIQAN